MYNSSETAEVLLNAGANVNEKDKYGLTPLHYAVSNNASETIEVLRRYGARR